MTAAEQSTQPYPQKQPLRYSRTSKQYFSPKYSALVTYSSKFDEPLFVRDSVFGKKRAISGNHISKSYRTGMSDPKTSNKIKAHSLPRNIANPNRQPRPRDREDANIFKKMTNKLYNWIYPVEETTVVHPSTPSPTKNRVKQVARSTSASQQKRTISTPQSSGIHYKKQRRSSSNSQSSSSSDSRNSSYNGVSGTDDYRKKNILNLQAKLNFSPSVNRSLQGSFSWESEQPKDKAQENQYGTTFFVNRKRAAVQRDYYNNSNELSYLKQIFQNDTSVDELKEAQRLEQEHLLRKDSKRDTGFKDSIIKLIDDIKKELQLKKQPLLNDDIIFIKEARTHKPAEITHREKLVFNKTFFDEEFKTYKKILEEREAFKKTLKEAKKKLIPVLNDKELNSVNAVFDNSYTARDPLSKAYQLEICKRDFKTLAPGRWLNDTIIEFYMKHIEANTEKTVTFNSFFFTALSERGYQGVRRWLKRKKVSINELDKVFVPINLNQSHWVLGMIDIKNKKICYIDSLGSPSRSNKQAFFIMKLLKSYVIEESGNTIGQDFEMEQLECPQQPNGYDCGIFVFMNCLYLSKDMPLTFDPSESTNMRKYVGNLILEKNGTK